MEWQTLRQLVDLTKSEHLTPTTQKQIEPLTACLHGSTNCIAVPKQN